MPGKLLEATLAAIIGPDETAGLAARERQAHLTKPEGALGQLEEVSIRLARITGQLRPALAPRSLIICAADHGVTAEDVSAYPQVVTQQMVLNFLNGGAAASVLCRQFDVNLVVLDAGVAGDLPEDDRLVAAKVRRGTANFAQEPAMSRMEAVQAIESGIEAAYGEIARGARVLLTGDMGIGNTTASSAIASVVTGALVSETTGLGTGIGLESWRKKCAIIAAAIEKHRPDPTDGLDILQKVGGLEIGAITGVILGGAARRRPVIIDGVVATAGALLATLLSPGASPFLFAGHRSGDHGHTAMLGHLDLRPLLQLDMRLGEGTGALLALPLLEAAVATLNEMPTFEEAGISGPSKPAVIAD